MPGRYRLKWFAFLATLTLGLLSAQVAMAAGNALSREASSSVSSPSSRAARAHQLGYSLTPSATEPYLGCSGATPGHAACMSIVIPPGATHRATPFSAPSQQGLSTLAPSYEGSGERGGFSPSDLRSAYNVAATGGSGQTVAIVDAYDDPNAEADLETYRSHYGLSKCTRANGCFKKVNQKGEEYAYLENEPAEDWPLEISLDLDMVSAICEECHILLVEANNNESSNLYAAENEAASLKPTEISNSWGGLEYAEETSADTSFNHPGIPITAAAGDSGYGAIYPAASQYVISVGGTKLTKAENSRGWEETVWSGSGSGCSLYEPKPAWQSDPSCARRTDNDTAAVASTQSPVSVYLDFRAFTQRRVLTGSGVLWFLVWWSSGVLVSKTRGG